MPLRNSTNVPLETHEQLLSRAVDNKFNNPPLDRNVHICNVVKNKVYKWLVLVLADPFDERLRRQFFSELVGCETVLGKTKVEIINN